MDLNLRCSILVMLLAAATFPSCATLDFSNYVPPIVDAGQFRARHAAAQEGSLIYLNSPTLDCGQFGVAFHALRWERLGDIPECVSSLSGTRPDLAMPSDDHMYILEVVTLKDGADSARLRDLVSAGGGVQLVFQGAHVESALPVRLISGSSAFELDQSELEAAAVGDLSIRFFGDGESGLEVVRVPAWAFTDFLAAVGSRWLDYASDDRVAIAPIAIPRTSLDRVESGK
jgi:hypothetical protein